MDNLKTAIILSALLLGLSSAAVAQQQDSNQTNQNVTHFQVNGECVVHPHAMNDTETPFMTCQYFRETGEMDQSFLEQMRERMRRIFGGDQSMQGMGGQ